MAALYGCTLERSAVDASPLDVPFPIDRSSSTPGLPGSLDASFGEGGRKLIAASAGDNAIWDSALTPDGGLLIVGNVATAAGDDIALVKLSSDGELESSFGLDGTGVVIIDAQNDNDNTCGVTLAPDGKIVVLGARGGADFVAMLVARLSANGLFDTAFDGDGIRSLDVGSTGQEFSCNAFFDTTGRTTVIGQATEGTTGTDIVAVRLLNDGRVDTAFGGGDGVVAFDLGADELVWRAAQQDASGRLVLGGHKELDATRWSLFVTRIDASGVLDTSFGTSGWFLADPTPGRDLVDAIALTSNGLVLAGHSSNAGFVMRLDANGQRDASFGDNGTAWIDPSTGVDATLDLAIDSAGRIVLGGYAQAAGNTDFLVARLESNGALDTTFGNGGLRTLDVGGTSFNDEAATLEQLPDGRILLGGWSEQEIGGERVRRFSTARFWP